MDYRESIAQLLTLVDHERNAVTGPRQKTIYDLTRMEALLGQLGSPQNQVPAVHIAGTKGKGSTAALCDSALHAAGLSTGFYSSPTYTAFENASDVTRNPYPRKGSPHWWKDFGRCMKNSRATQILGH